MSRRERSGRDSDSRRYRSGFDREPSPKRSRRDGKPETERVPSTTDLNVEDRSDRDQKHQRSGRDEKLDTEKVPSTTDLNVEDRRDRDQKHQRSRRDEKPDTERVPSTTDLNVKDRGDRDQMHQRSRRDGKLDAERVPSTTDLNVEDRRDRDQKHQRSRRDGKPETERVPSTTDLKVEDGKDQDQKHQRRLQDALPLEVPSVTDSKVESGIVNKDSDKKLNGLDDGNKRVSDPTDIPRSRSYFQHDERGYAAQVGRSFDRRATTDRRWRDSKDESKKILVKRDNSDVWHHDGFIKMEAEAAPPVRKRPAFREKKMPVDSENAEKEAPQPVKPSHSARPMSLTERRGERDHNPHYSDRHERPFTGDRKEAQRGGFLSRERYGSGGERYGSGGGGGGGKQWGRERLSGSNQGYRPGGNRAEKWKHDLFDEANKSPTPKNEEDQIAKVEELLSS